MLLLCSAPRPYCTLAVKSEPGTALRDVAAPPPGQRVAEADGGVDEGEEAATVAAEEEGVSAVDGFFDGKAYRLVPTEGGENTILINGVKMHISQGKLPSQDAEDKARLAKVRKGSVVLDVCCGLGYSAIACARLGARRVVTLELDPCVLEVARQNPQRPISPGPHLGANDITTPALAFPPSPR
ncbi:hypothetical protein TSOC_000238 [Tetrabaena socialis]|uniref:Uncharacterized protein n=1 Tax=Tetrabaena socialis TaxID=47790 RepID=A0A2J8AJW9_9CHLO|nr:hypothetical protein TSOC_000238 [Tetrabaena socialis]|eukprot:PNH12811.1 hypothetical protein TSOC_000238 [Tetrabaena socialis]